MVLCFKVSITTGNGKSVSKQSPCGPDVLVPRRECVHVFSPPHQRKKERKKRRRRRRRKERKKRRKQSGKSRLLKLQIWLAGERRQPWRGGSAGLMQHVGDYNVLHSPAVTPPQAMALSHKAVVQEGKDRCGNL